ncbi:MAG TPA: ATP-dependent helicase C-terminal domain-containing protein [Bryobacteraceae bacterium]
MNLPIDPLLPQIVESVAANAITLLQAEPGAGKTTRVPAALLAAGLAHICVLEPRRLAARMAARRVAEELGEPIGQTVGYQVRFEEVSSPRTRLWYLTEGVLTRKLLADRTQSLVRVVILDEFHERHVETDLALALLRDLQKRRPDFRLLIMSATLAGSELASALGHPPLIQSPGRLFPVSIQYTPQSSTPLEEQVSAAVGKALAQTSKHVLVFLPGSAEIVRALQSCAPAARQAGAKLLALHGNVSPDEQDLAVQPSAQRKIICSTNVAESSVTIEGVEAVIDSGLARVMSHSPWSGLSHLRLEKISQASAVQRSGRAGRTSAGMAIRLYPESDFVRRPAQMPPEIVRADLSPVMLQLAAHGLAWDDLDWIEAPPPGLLQSARDLLLRLTALNPQGEISATGRRIVKLPVHPRLARFVIAAAEMGGKREASEQAARLSENNPHSANRVRQQLADQLREPSVTPPDPHAVEKALLLAFSDRVARKRGDKLVLSNGAGAKLDRSLFIHGEFMVALEIDGRSDQPMPLVRIASAIEPDWLLDFFPERVEAREELAWNREAERVEQVNSLRYEQLVIDESRGAPTDPIASAAILAEKAIEAGAERFTDAEELAHFLHRVHFAAGHGAGPIPDDLVSIALRDLAAGCTSFAELRAGDLLAILRGKLSMRAIEEIAPTHVQLPKGRRAKIEYHEGRPPSVASRLQDFFGMKESPTVARGAVPLVVQLLAPNQRPVQVTTDLVSFWKNLYPQVRRELSRRYPKHAWPEVPT